MESGSHIRLLLWKAGKAIERVDKASITETGLHLSEFTIMEALLHKGPMPINTIGEKVLLTSGSMTAAVNRLENKGYVERIQDPSDGRCYFVHLTRSGKKTIKRAYAKHAKNLDKIIEVLSSTEQAELARLLKTIGRHAEKIQPT
jgi:MarR family 2-MHQ and catechol resistance regulon transcriptional repressor